MSCAETLNEVAEMGSKTALNLLILQIPAICFAGQFDGLDLVCRLSCKLCKCHCAGEQSLIR